MITVRKYAIHAEDVDSHSRFVGHAGANSPACDTLRTTTDELQTVSERPLSQSQPLVCEVSLDACVDRTS
jgi:hypothetical protein